MAINRIEVLRNLISHTQAANNSAFHGYISIPSTYARVPVEL